MVLPVNADTSTNTLSRAWDILEGLCLRKRITFERHPGDIIFSMGRGSHLQLSVEDETIFLTLQTPNSTSLEDAYKLYDVLEDVFHFVTLIKSILRDRGFKVVES